jgi:hypothetical protein
MIITEADNIGDQILLQSDYRNGLMPGSTNLGTPGVNRSTTIAETQKWAGFEWYSEIPGLGVILLGSGG